MGCSAASSRARVIEGTSGRWSCLRRGDCDAVVLGQPQDLHRGAAGLSAARRFRPRSCRNCSTPSPRYGAPARRPTRRPWFATSGRLADAFASSAIRATATAWSGRIVMQSTGVSEDIARETLALLLRAGPRRPAEAGRDRPQGLDQVIAMMGEAGTLKAPLPSPERFVDLQYLRAAGRRNDTRLEALDTLEIDHPVPARGIALDVGLHVLGRRRHRDVADAWRVSRGCPAARGFRRLRG